jgi:AbrB family looped-hinge helix DNA binding protein
MMRGLKCYGSTVISEKGQIVIPAEVRKIFKIKAGDKFLVMAGLHGSGIMLLKTDTVAKYVRQVFGDDLSNLFETGAERKPTKAKPSKRSKKTRK